MSKTAFLKSIFSFCIFLFFTNPDVWAEAGDLVWKYRTNAQILTSPAIGINGTIYFCSYDDYFYAINTDGTLKWKFKTEYIREDLRVLNNSPTIGSDGTIYFGAHYTYLYALNTDGIQKWRFIVKGGILASSPAIDSEGNIYFGSYDYGLYSLTPEGTINWRYQMNLGNDRIWYSSPAISLDGTIYVGSRDSYFYAFNADGTRKWTFKTGGCIDSSPAIDSYGTVYFASDDNFLYALNPDGTQKWKYNIGYYNCESVSPVIGNDNIIYMGSEDGYLYAFYTNGTIKWRYQTEGSIKSSAVVCSDGNIYIGSNDTYLYALGPDGSLRWKYKTNSAIEASPTINPQGIIYVASTDGYLYAIDSGTQSGIYQGSWPKFHSNIRNTGRISNFSVSSSYIEITGVPLNGSGSETFYIKNVGPTTISIDSIFTNNELFSIETYSSEIPPFENVEVIVTFKPETYDDVSSDIIITLNTNDIIYIYAYGSISKPKIDVSTDLVDFGYVNINDTATDAFIIKNEGETDLTIYQIISDNPELIIEPNSFIVAPSDSESIIVTLYPQNIGRISTNITIESNDPNRNKVTLLTQYIGFEKDLSQIQLNCMFSVVDAFNGTVHIEEVLTGNALKEMQNIDFFIKNFNIYDIEFSNEDGTIFDYENWEENFQNYFRVQSNNSSEIRIKCDFVMEYIVPYDEYAVHAGSKDSLLNEYLGKALGARFFIISPTEISVIPEVTFYLPNEWKVLSENFNYGDYLHYNFNNIYAPVMMGNFEIFEKTILGTKFILPFYKYDEYIPKVNIEFGFSIFEYFTNILGPYKKAEKISIGSAGLFDNPLLSYYEPLSYEYDLENYDLNNLLLFPHSLAIDFLPYTIGGESWFGEGYTAYYQIASLYESGNASLKLFYKSLQTSKYNYDNIIYGNAEEVSLHDSDTISSSNVSLCWQIKEDKGTLVTFLLDKKIREITSNTKNINDFSRYIYKKYFNEKYINNFDDYEMLNSINTFIGNDFTDFFNRYIFGLDKLPLDDYLIDNDGDGLLNFTEDNIGTDKDVSDNDSDGINDALESYYYFTDPFNESSFPNISKKTYKNYNKKIASVNKKESSFIVVDGYGDDWNNIPVLAHDPDMDFGGFEYDDADIQNIKTYRDNDDLYIYIDFYAGNSRTIAYDLLFDTKGSPQFDYALRYDIFGNTFLYNIYSRNPEDLINYYPFGIREVSGACKDVLEVSIPLFLFGSTTSLINVEVKTVDCIQVSTVNSPSVANARELPYIVGDTANFSILLVTIVENRPLEFHISPPFPNPFNPYTIIQYQLPIECYVEFTIYDILGRKVAILEDKKMDAGVHQTIWNGKSENGRDVGSGVYLYRVKAGKYVKHGKMLLLR